VFSAIICKPAIGLSQTFYPPASEALGESGRAGIQPLDALFLNPAALALSRSQYEFAGLYRSNAPGTESPTVQWGAAVVDNSPDVAVAGGAYYLSTRQASPSNTINDSELAVATGSHALEKLSFGVLGKRIGRSNLNGPSWVKYNADIGFLLTPDQNFGVAFVANNILNDDDLDLIPQLSVGVNWDLPDILRLTADVSRYEKKNPERKGKLGAGVEFDAGEGFFLRTGSIWDSYAGQRYWTAGLGWIGPKLSLDYAYRMNTDVVGDQAHTFDLRLIF